MLKVKCTKCGSIVQLKTDGRQVATEIKPMELAQKCEACGQVAYVMVTVA